MTITETEAQKVETCICGKPWDDLFMIECDVCSVWVHQVCSGLDELSAQNVQRFHCANCAKEHGPTQFKSAKVNSGLFNCIYQQPASSKNIANLLKRKNFEMMRVKKFKRSNASNTLDEDCFNLAYIQKHGFADPVLFEKGAQMDMKMPSSKISVRQISRLTGNIPVEIMDVHTQEPLVGWKMNDWADYFHSTEKQKLLNVISLEVSDTEFGQSIQRPAIVRELDWVDKYWPKDLEGKPKVQKYCLMSPAGCWTDFHVDFGGTSVYYHLLSGKKFFYMIPPTPENLRMYLRFSTSPEQSKIFFADWVRKCFQITLHAGETMLIPSGWIHGVYTPEDSIVIGGNLLHNFAARMQLSVYNLEDNCKIPQLYRFPNYQKLCWLVLAGVENRLRKNLNSFSEREIVQLSALPDFLFKLIMKLNDKNGPSEDRKFIKESIPSHLKADYVGLVKSCVALMDAVSYPNTKSVKPKSPEPVKKRKVYSSPRIVSDSDEESDHEESPTKKENLPEQNPPKKHKPVSKIVIPAEEFSNSLQSMLPFAKLKK
ncbi:hypothetical protein MP638_007469 [Amoeboaphelidium occidentale]|nr:hypothetical protein MP638_007469 [Amoeboaphelidium occidentale]